MHSVLAGLTLLGGKLLSNLPERIFFSPRVNLFKLGGKVQQGQVQVPAVGLVQNFEDWQVCYNIFFSVKKLYDSRSANKLYDSRSAKK